MWKRADPKAKKRMMRRMQIMIGMEISSVGM